MRENVASRVQAPLAFRTKANFAKVGAYLRDTTATQLINLISIIQLHKASVSQTCCTDTDSHVTCSKT